MLYLDSAATTPVRREVLEAMWPYLTQEFGNASSHHEAGRRALAGLDRARATVAQVLNCRPAEVVFTSGGTEADNLAVKGIALGRRDRDPARTHVVTSAVEHSAVLGSARDLARWDGFELTELGVTAEGLVEPDSLAGAVRAGTAVVSVMHANNETGAVQEIAELAAVARARDVPFHTDAVQAAGALELDVQALHVAALSLAGHKIGGPKGTGVLYLRRGTPLRPLLSGGGHERGRRSGTSDVAGAVGFATALRLAAEERPERAVRLAGLRDRLIAGILSAVPTAVLTGPDPRERPAARLPGNASFCFPGVNGETVLVDLEARGLLVSSGSACSAGDTEPSHVLTAMGIPAEVATTAVRFTLSAEVTPEQVDGIVAAVRDVVGRLGAPRG
ncbi:MULTISPECIES: cysteine desulfurase family protein [Kocuria]|uniref:Cysteine desulfurase n=1 Tax=Kocuria rosea subsp. polaris TaxID=136273 RepID=A0A0W8IN89_KOCRO|nr:cysteine desulfurase family protein [Kocuria polaris]KUG61354.1 cysteine desulfurase [Kocuria polaris]